MVYEHKGGSPSKEAMVQFGSPAVASVGAAISHKLATSTMTSRAPLLPTCVYRSLILGKQEKTVSGCQENSPALHNAPTLTKDPLTFSPPSKNKTPTQFKSCFLFVCSNTFSHSLPPLCASSTSPGVLRVCAPQEEIQALIGS